MCASGKIITRYRHGWKIGSGAANSTLYLNCSLMYFNAPGMQQQALRNPILKKTLMR